MTRFSRLELIGRLVETDVREIAQSDMLACPHAMMVAKHYRPYGACRCDDPTHIEMERWGYRWRDGRWRSQSDDE
jgi:hypothetical protein